MPVLACNIKDDKGGGGLRIKKHLFWESFTNMGLLDSQMYCPVSQNELVFHHVPVYIDPR